MDSEIEKRIQQLHEQIIASISLQRINLVNYATKKDITQVLDNNFEVLQKFAKSIDGEFKNVKSKLGEQASSQKENMELISAAINSITTIKAQIFQIKTLLGGRENEIEKKIKEIEKTLKNLLEKEKININLYADQLRDKAEKNHQHKEYSLKTDLVNLEKKLEKRNNTEQYAQKIQKLEANIENDKKELQSQIILEKTLNKSSIDSISQKLIEKAEIDHEHDQYTLYSDFETEVKKLKEEIKKKKRPINYITDGGGGGGGDTLVDYENVVFVAKHGDDANSGLNENTPKLTIGAAITTASALTPSASNVIVVRVLDGGKYEEGIVVPSWIVIDASQAELYLASGINILLSDNSIASFNKITNAKTGGDFLTSTCIAKVSGTGMAKLYAKEVYPGEGGAGAINFSSGTQLFLRIEKLVVPASSFGIYSGDDGAGHIHLYIGDIYLNGDNAIGIWTYAEVGISGTIVGHIEHILSISGSSGRTAIFMSGSDDIPRIDMSVDEIGANIDSAINIQHGICTISAQRIVGNIDVSSGASLYIQAAQHVSGTITNAGTIVGHLGTNYYNNIVMDGASKIIGGTGTTSDLTLQTTSGVGTTGADMHFLVGNNGAIEAMTILNNGNVGIGTSSPDVLIHGRGTNPAFAVSSSSGGNFAKLMSGSGGSVFYFRNDKYFAIVPTGSVTDTGGAGSTSFYMDGATGKIGIGNTNPGAKLQIDTGAASTIGAIIKGAASQSANLQQWRNSSGGVLSYVDSVGQIVAPGIASDIFKDSNLNSYLSITGASPTARNITLGSTIIADTITLNTKTSGLINLNGTSTIIASDSATNTVTNSLIAGHNTSGTPANGYGTGLLFTGESSTTPDRLMGRVKTIWSDASDATRTSKMILSTYDLATEKEVLTLDENGNVGINNTSPTSTIHILSQSDTIGLIVKGSASQTTDYFKITDSSDSPLVYLNKIGELTTSLSYDASVDAPSVNYSPASLNITLQLVNDGNYGNNTSAAIYNLDVRVGSSRTTYALNATAAYRGNGVGHSYIAAGAFNTYIESTSEEVVTNAVGGLFAVINATNRAAYADNIIAGDFAIHVGCNRSVTATSATFLNIRSVAEDNTNMAVTTVYGIKIADQDVGATNYAIYTGAGNIVFNSGYDADTDFTVGSDSYDAIYVDASNNATYIMTNASGKISFFGASPVAQQSELTDELTTITHTAPGTPDYAIQDLTNVAPYGFVTQEEGNTVLSVIANLQARVNEVETKLVAYGLLPDAD